MDWIAGINRAMEDIEQHLDGEIDYERLAALAGCSSYNFQRMFSYIADRPLSDYIRARRMTVAAFELTGGTQRVLDVAVKYGYESADAFSRAFHRFHGVLPSQARCEAVMLKSCPKISFQIRIEGEKHMNYQIETWPAFTITGYRHTLRTNESFQEVPLLWDTAAKDGSMQRLFQLFHQADYRPAGILGVAAGGQWGAVENASYYLAVTTHVETEGVAAVAAPEGMEQRRIPSATWAIFQADGKMPEAIQSVYKYFYSQWLPTSGYELDDVPVIESYMQNDHQEVWVGIKKS